MATAIARIGWSWNAADESDTEEDGSIVEERCLIVDWRQGESEDNPPTYALFGFVVVCAQFNLVDKQALLRQQVQKCRLR
jgi:hypothetical protein